MSRPGTAIAKVWQGQVELTLRVIVILCSIATLATSILALNHIQENFPSSIPPLSNDLLEQITGFNYNMLIRNSTAAPGIGIALAFFVMVYEIILIIIRFVNIGFININIKLFLGIDVIISLILSALFGLVGILAAYTASQWAELAIKPKETRVRDLLAILAGSSLIEALFVALLMAWLILFLCMKWNKRIVDKNEEGSTV